MGTNYVNDETDDVVLGIADKYRVVYTLSVIPATISGSPGNAVQLYPSITKNGEAIAKDVSYLSSASLVASTSGSGLITLLTSGSCNINVSLTDNNSVFSNIPVTVAGSPVSSVYEIRVNPNVDYILEGGTEVFTTYLYLNGIQQGDAFAYAINGTDVLSDKYIFTTINTNSFSIENTKMDLEHPLLVDITSGSHTKQIDISLRGAW
jgi:hypothetical protein